jgi:hypothetical protein
MPTHVLPLLIGDGKTCRSWCTVCCKWCITECIYWMIYIHCKIIQNMNNKTFENVGELRVFVSSHEGWRDAHAHPPIHTYTYPPTHAQQPTHARKRAHTHTHKNTQTQLTDKSCPVTVHSSLLNHWVYTFQSFYIQFMQHCICFKTLDDGSNPMYNICC